MPLICRPFCVPVNKDSSVSSRCEYSIFSARVSFRAGPRTRRTSAKLRRIFWYGGARVGSLRPAGRGDSSVAKVLRRLFGKHSDLGDVCRVISTIMLQDPLAIATCITLLVSERSSLVAIPLAQLYSESPGFCPRQVRTAPDHSTAMASATLAVLSDTLTKHRAQENVPGQ